MNLKNGKVFTSKFIVTGPSSYEKKYLLGRGLIKVGKHWSIQSDTEDTVHSMFKMMSLVSSGFCTTLYIINCPLRPTDLFLKCQSQLQLLHWKCSMQGKLMANECEQHGNGPWVTIRGADILAS